MCVGVANFRGKSLSLLVYSPDRASMASDVVFRPRGHKDYRN